MTEYFKPNKRRRVYRKNEFRLTIFSNDGRRCMNQFCEQHIYTKSGVRYDPHHIIPRAHVDPKDKFRDSILNGMMLCDTCHDKVHGKSNPMDADGNHITGYEFMLMILDAWKDRPDYRWRIAHAWIKDVCRKDRRVING